MQVAIAGAGLIGRLLGWRLAEDGARVTLYERASRHAPESAAHVAAAMLAPVSELPDTEPLIFQQGRESLAQWQAWLPMLDVPHGVDGSLLVAHGQDAPLLEKFFRSLGAYQHLATWQDAAGIAALEPALAGRFHRGLLLAGEGWLDNRALLSALETRCGHIRYNEPLTPTASSADVVIDCRGVGARLPELRGVRGEAVRLRAPEVHLTRPVRLMHPRYQLYVAPRPPNGYVVGATQLESGLPKAVTVRSALELLSAAFALHPGFAEAEVTELCAGLRPAFPDNLPRVEWRDGVLSVNGLYRHGFLIAPAVVDQALGLIEAAMAPKAGAGRSVAATAADEPRQAVAAW